jgi:vacuolar-type H+-ATPase subunit H
LLEEAEEKKKKELAAAKEKAKAALEKAKEDAKKKKENLIALAKVYHSLRHFETQKTKKIIYISGTGIQGNVGRREGRDR